MEREAPPTLAPMAPNRPPPDPSLRLREEIRQTRPFHSIGQEAVIAVFRTADELRRRYGDLLEGAGLTLQQYNVLRILRGAGERGLPTLEVGERMMERTPGVTRIVDRLVRKGFVARERGREDRRRVWCRITAEGLRVLGELDGPVNALDDEHFTDVPEDELRQMIGMLERVRLRRRGSTPPAAGAGGRNRSAR